MQQSPFDDIVNTIATSETEILAFHTTARVSWASPEAVEGC